MPFSFHAILVKWIAISRPEEKADGRSVVSGILRTSGLCRRLGYRLEDFQESRRRHNLDFLITH